MKTERELFEEWYERAIGRSIVYKTYDKSYLNSKTQEAWLTWQASASREGYKLVPAEPSSETLKLMKDAYEEHLSEGMSDAYKSMLEAA